LPVRAETSSPTPLLAARERWLDGYAFETRLAERGNVVSIGDGVAWIHGLPSAAMDEILRFADSSRAMVFYLGADAVGAVLLDPGAAIAAGSEVHLSGERLTIPVGDGLFGRVVDPLGVPLDGGEPIQSRTTRPLDALSPPIVERDFVNAPLYTGNRIVDALIPIGRGQRQLVIGDNGVGKTALALDAVLNQRGRDVPCVYVLVGQRRSTVVDVVETLRRENALGYTTVVVAEASAMPGLKYLAPFAGCAVAEHWMRAGRDTLVVYDDLTAHARTYRELSLLLRRPPGREAYPGDIFHLHARLLERSTHLAAGQGGGSMTALAIAETDQGDITGYIPTNLVSITDGQLYLDRRLFAAGFLPAIDVARSVSRIGGAAQDPRMKEEAGRMKLDYLQFLELEVFTRFGARLEASIEARIRRGRVLRELLKQDRLAPESETAQMAWLVAYNDGLLDSTEPGEAARQARALAAREEISRLTLQDKRETWAAAVRSALAGLKP
jgi:F-type H+/Na+-transporting ATPase subunit alpha